ncbi:DNA polymerase III subunit epsilon [Buchnera aphidicola]|uniref:DNA polymerase III subunit epsilon n=1 Tax=Buchnera aphidicola (Cinara cf. splendens/pseudotsugae 3390) TaxID=2518980 RepID=A0A451CXB0_9GAMM|nr:DNA polymerase III subunit epsilon [Buchnera aphidicola]VFP77736.1 DNA polymerase III subunit epsilon [Buchnera aphidicola (Cinara cf. splendens/pseudotsugae 3390)]
MNSLYNSRQVILDIETTGMNKSGCLYLNHKIIEIGIIEIIDRKYTGKYLHYYLNPKRIIEEEAYKIHGISNKFLSDKPYFSDVYLNIINFIKKSEIIVHNSVFDISFLDYEFSKLNLNISKICEFSTITDTLFIARKLFPGKKNSLDALCSRYNIKNSRRNFHGALLDSWILFKLYLYMTSKQQEIKFQSSNIKKTLSPLNSEYNQNKPLKILFASVSEKKNHQKYINMINKNYI